MDFEKLTVNGNPKPQGVLIPDRFRRWAFLLRVPLWVTVSLVGSFQAFGAQSVTLAWNANMETNLAGYRLYYGPASRSYTGKVEIAVPNVTATVTNLEAGRTNYFALTAYTRDGLESDYSDEVKYVVPGPKVDLLPTVTESLVVAAEAPAELLPFPAETEEIVKIVGGDEAEAIEPTVVIDSSASSGGRLEIVPVGQPTVACFLRFEAPANRDCELQVSNDLLSWRPLVPFKVGAASKRFEFVDLEVKDPRRYYRLLIQ